MSSWVPPAYRNKMGAASHRASMGADTQQVKDWFKENKTAVLIGGAILVGAIVLLAYRNRSIMGMQVGEVPAAAPVVPSARAENSVADTVAEQALIETPAMAPFFVAPASGQPIVATLPRERVRAPAACADSGIPKPYNVYQDDGLSGANDKSLGPGVAPYSANAAGAPVDYAGQCSGVNPAAVWQSSQLLPAQCGQSLEGTSDWNIYAPSNYQVTSFLAAGQNFGQDTVSTTLKNASLDLRPEPVIPQAGCSQVPFGQSSWVDNGINRVDYSHSLVA